MMRRVLTRTFTLGRKTLLKVTRTVTLTFRSLLAYRTLKPKWVALIRSPHTTTRVVLCLNLMDALLVTHTLTVNLRSLLRKGAHLVTSLRRQMRLILSLLLKIVLILSLVGRFLVIIVPLICKGTKVVRVVTRITSTLRIRSIALTLTLMIRRRRTLKNYWITFLMVLLMAWGTLSPLATFKTVPIPMP